jgi:hypothetical protein
MLRFAKCFGAARARDGERTHDVPEFQTVLDRFAADILMDKTGIETVAGADVVDRFHFRRPGFESGFGRDGHGSLGASLYHYNCNFLGKAFRREIETVNLGEFARLAGIGKKDIDIFEELREIREPAIVRIVIGIQGSGQSGGFGLAKNLGQGRLQGFLQKIRRNVQMFCAEDVVEVQIFFAHLEHRAGIGEDIALFALRENDRKAGGLAGHLPDAGEIDSTFAQTLQAYFSQWVSADGGAEADLVSDGGKIVSKNGGRAAEGDPQIVGEVFAFQGELGGEAGKYKVEIQFSDGTHVERGQSFSLLWLIQHNDAREIFRGIRIEPLL